jgi:hypothetical protein
MPIHRRGAGISWLILSRSRTTAEENEWKEVVSTSTGVALKFLSRALVRWLIRRSIEEGAPVFNGKFSLVLAGR